MMTNDDYQHFVCIVAGDNPDELMKPYDRREKEEPYVRYHYKDAAKIKEKYIELYEGILNSDEETIDKEELEDIVNDLKEMSVEEFYEELTEGLTIDDKTGDAISTENRQGMFSYYEIGKWLSVPFLLKGGREVSVGFMDKLNLVAIVTHVADARTCVLHPASHTHRQMTDEQLIEAGVAPDLIRLSVGIENADDIIEDLRQALAII